MPARSRQPKPFATGVTSFSPKRGRFALPVDVLQSAGWEESPQSQRLVAEIVASGHIRLHRPSAITPAIAAEEAEIRRDITDLDEQEIRLQILADRFREATFSPEDNNRVSLSQDVVLVLCGPEELERSIKLFIQAGTSAIDVMTNTVRLNRLARNA